MRNTQIFQQHGFFCGKGFYTEKSNLITETSEHLLFYLRSTVALKIYIFLKL